MQNISMNLQKVIDTAIKTSEKTGDNLFSSNGFTDEYNYDHLRGITVFLFSKDYDGTSDSQICIDANGKTTHKQDLVNIGYRGRPGELSVGLHFRSECDKDFTFFLCFHKGNTFSMVSEHVPDYVKPMMLTSAEIAEVTDSLEG